MNVIRWCKKKMEVPLMLWLWFIWHVYREKNSAAADVMVHWPDMFGSYGMYIERKTQQQQMLWLKMQSRCVNCDIKMGPELGGEIECK
ncbi:hypothetical protein AMTRI_Chr06g197610 [Amborella trichopoda]